MIDRNSLGELANALRGADVSENSIGTAVTILEEIGKFSPNDDLPKDPEDWFGAAPYSPATSGINFIPSEYEDICHDLLVTVCAGETNFYLHTMGTIALCINCHSTIKAVIVAADSWVEKDFNKWRKSSFEALYDQFGIMFFIFTPHAGRWTFDQIVPSAAKVGKKKK